MSQAQHVDDGDFKVATQNGPWKYTYPFSEQGDFITFVATREMRQAEDSFTPPNAMTRRTFNGQRSSLSAYTGDGLAVAGSLVSPGIGYLVKFTDPTEAGNALLEWTERWASIPEQRTEYGSTTYEQIVGLNSGTSDFTYGEVAYGSISAILDAKFVYDYALNMPPTTLHAPRFINTTGGHTFVFGSIQEILAQSGFVLAQDSESSIYGAKIFCRKSTYANRARPKQID